MRMDGLLILGAGGYGRTVAEAARAIGGFDRIVFLDDSLRGEEILGRCARAAEYRGKYRYAYPAFGDNMLRADWMGRLEYMMGYELPVLIHPRAYVSPSARIAAGAVVLAMAAVGTNTVISRGAIVNMGAIVDHDCTVGACAHLAPGAIVKAGNNIPARVKVDSGCVIERGAVFQFEEGTHV